MKTTHSLQKFTILFFCFITFYTATNAQQRIGILGGVNIPRLVSDDGFGKSTGIMVRYHVGLFANLKLTDQLSIEPVLGYSHKGWCFDSLSVVGAGSMNLHYAEAKLLLKYALNDNFSITGGTAFNYLLKTIRKPEIFFSYTNFYEKIDISAILGIDSQLNERIGIYSRLEYGISYLSTSTLTDMNGNEIETIKDGHNLVLQIGLTFNLLNKDKADNSN